MAAAHAHTHTHTHKVTIVARLSAACIQLCCFGWDNHKCKYCLVDRLTSLTRYTVILILFDNRPMYVSNLIAMSPGLNCACVNSSSHFNHSSYCVLFYLIVLYGCVCQPLINGYDDDAIVVLTCGTINKRI